MLKRVLQPLNLQPLKTLQRQKWRGLCPKSALRLLKLVLQVLNGLIQTPNRPP
jgi:hypothetical protein